MYLLLLAAILLFTVQTIRFKEFSRRFMKTKADYFFFSGLNFLLVVVILSAIFGFGRVALLLPSSERHQA